MLAYGALVGALEFRHIGDTPCRIGGEMSIEQDLLFEVEFPNGTITVLKNRNPLKSRAGSQSAYLGPGDFAITPICLLKFGGKFIFSEDGKHRIRAGYGQNTIPIQDVDTGKKSSVFKLKSNWVEFTVKPIGRGQPNFVNSHPEENIYDSFHFRAQAAGIQIQLQSYGDYVHEQEKFIVYQALGLDLVRGILVEQEYDQDLVNEAKRARAFAKQVGVGESMWEWMVSKLESFPKQPSKPKSARVKNGYYF